MKPLAGETYIPARHVTHIYGIPHNHLNMLRREYGVRVQRYGKQYKYCEEDVINYIFRVTPKKPRLFDLVTEWFAGYDKNEPLAEDTIRQCAAELNVSRSTVYKGWVKYKNG